MNSKLMKRLCIVATAVLGLTVVLGCGGNKQGAPAADSGKKKIVIGASFVSKDNQWWAMCGQFAQEAAKKNGVEMIMLYANNDQEKQIKDVEDLIQRKVDVILMGPVQEKGSAVAVDQAAKAGIPVVTIARRSASQNVTTGVIFNEPQFGINQVTQLRKDFPEGANVVYLFGPVGAGYAMQQYNEGFAPELAKNPNLKLLQKYDCPTDTSAEGMRNAEDALVKYTNIDVICATNDDLALGAVRAVEAAGKAGKIKVYGSSALPLGMQAIYDGKMHFTNLKSQSVEAMVGVELALKVVNKQPLEKMVYLQPTVVTRENVETVKDSIFGGTLDDPKSFVPKK
ncbi:MAG: sugar ABC transporter substrate-binding protein [Negativicutes bacterium]|nr:sugar ABC transporter substrate-binding protein [Negativicutes bacterium]